MKLTWFGHAAFRLEANGAVILVDPFFTGNPAFTGDVATASAGCTHVVLTHGHDDHTGDVIDIVRATGATVIANFDLCMYLADHGVEKFDPMNTGGTVHHDGFSVTLVAAVHSSATYRDGQSIFLGNANGAIISPAGEKVLYHMGDTDIFGDMALINEIWKPQIGLVPIGDRFTMNPKTAALACKRFFDFETVIPCHYGSFPIIEQTADGFLAEMAGENVVVPERNAPLDL